MQDTIFSVRKNDVKNLDRFQVNKARYWFKKFIDIYNNGYVSWNDIEFQLSFYTQLTDNLELFRKFYEATHNIWQSLFKNFDNHSLTIDQFLDTWGALYDYVKKTDKIPDVFFQLFKSVYDIYDYNNQLDFAFDFRNQFLLNVQSINGDFKNEPSLFEIIGLIKRFIMSDKTNDFSYYLVPGLDMYLEDCERNYVYQINHDVNKAQYMDGVNNLYYSNNDVFNTPTLSYTTDTDSPKEHYYAIGSGAQSPTSISSFESHQSNTNLNEIHPPFDLISSPSNDMMSTMKEQNIVAISNQNISVVPSDSIKEINVQVQKSDAKTNEEKKPEVKVEKKPAIEAKEKMRVGDAVVCEYLVDENMTEEELIKYVLQLQEGDGLNIVENNEEKKKNDDFEFTIKSMYTVMKDSSSIFFETTEPKSRLEYVVKPTLNRRYHRSSFYEEFKNSREFLKAKCSSSHIPRSMTERRSYSGEFKNSRLSLDRSPSEGLERNSRSYSRTLRQEYKRRRNLNSFTGSNEDNESGSFVRRNIRQEFKRSANLTQYADDSYYDEEHANDEITDNQAKRSFTRGLRSEFKRSKTSLNALKESDRRRLLSSENQDNELEETESFAQIDIKHPRITAIKNSTYGGEFKTSIKNREIQKSPINFPRNDDEPIGSNNIQLRRLSRGNQLNNQLYGYNSDIQNSAVKAYSTQSLPQMDENEKDVIANPTLSLNDPSSSLGALKIIQSKLLNKKAFNKNISKINDKPKPKAPKIDLDLLDEEELSNIRDLLKLNGIETTDAEIQLEGPKEAKNPNLKSLKERRMFLAAILLEMRREAAKHRKYSSRKFNENWKKLKLLLENEAIYEIIDDIAYRTPSSVKSETSEDRLIQKIVSVLKPFIRQCVREEVHRYISSITKQNKT